jgi:hypothetical protein
MDYVDYPIGAIAEVSDSELASWMEINGVGKAVNIVQLDTVEEIPDVQDVPELVVVDQAEDPDG